MCASPMFHMVSEKDDLIADKISSGKLKITPVHKQQGISGGSEGEILNTSWFLFILT